MNICDKSYAILKKLSGLETVSASDRLQTDLAFDSMMMVTLLLELEDSFQIELDESDMNPFDFVTAGDIVALMERYCGGPNEENC